MNTHDEILRGMALAFFASAFADQAEENGTPLRGEIMDQLPLLTDKAAILAADTLAKKIVLLNGVSSIDPNETPLEKLYIKAGMVNDGTGDKKLEPELFGHYCAMQAMGTGVGLESFGGAIHDTIKVPYVEFGNHSLEKDYF